MFTIWSFTTLLNVTLKKNITLTENIICSIWTERVALVVRGTKYGSAHRTQRERTLKLDYLTFLRIVSPCVSAEWRIPCIVWQVQCVTEGYLSAVCFCGHSCSLCSIAKLTEASSSVNFQQVDLVRNALILLWKQTLIPTTYIIYEKTWLWM